MTTTPDASSDTAPPEAELRLRLGVPAEAAQVMIITESTHWDPNWLVTSTEYFRLLVRRTLDRVIDELVAEPRRVFSLECVFFPDLYWDHRPERRAQFRSLVNEGRLRFSGSGVTTPDTLLPEDEVLLRDVLLGQEWLRSRGMSAEPRILYFPDSFGHSPGTPSLLAAAGVSYAAVCRIDGMRFPGADMESTRSFPRPGTSAERLLAEGTADFVWRGPDGSEVLTHWMTYGYGHGDMIASGGLSRALALPTAWPDRRPHRVAARIEGYIDQLTRVARTPYLLLAIGFDFVRPVPRLVDLLDQWNATNYETSGVWLVNAGLDDYLDLVAHHRSVLPTLSLDPNPYWMGFYASRPDTKRACRDLGRHLTDADNERAWATMPGTVPPGGSGGTKPTERRGESNRTIGTGRDAGPQGLKRTGLAAARWTSATSNHHDYVTGTAPDRVAKGEQMRWLHAALAESRASGSVARGGDGPPPADPSATAVTWARHRSEVTVSTPWLSAVFDEHRGGTLVSLRTADGVEQLRAPSLELCSYVDSGGLWRMGNEFNGGRWGRHDRTADHPATVTVTEHPDGSVRVAVGATLEDRPVGLTVEFGAHAPSVVVHTSVTSRLRRTVTLAVHRRAPIASIDMHQPGGMVSRELARWYEPTFWPLHSFASARPGVDADGRSDGLSIAVAVPTAVHATASGTVETVVARTAVKELAFGVVPVLAPAWGRRWGTQTADLALDLSPVPDTAAAITIGRRLQGDVDRSVGRSVPTWLVEVDDPLVEVITVKVADRGLGIIVRLRNWAPPDGTRSVRLALAPGADGTITRAWSADSRERDVGDLVVDDGAVRVDLATHLATIRLEVDPRTG